MKQKKLLSLLLAVAMAFSLTVPAVAAEGDDAQAAPYVVPADLSGEIVLLHTNDVHGAIGTYAKVAALKDALEEKGAYVLLMDAGDFIQGDPAVSTSEGASAVELMNLTGYDVAAPGNHEFDYGYANLKELAGTAQFPIVAANVLYEGAVAFQANTIFTTDAGVKIGVFGLDTPETATKAHPAKIAGVTFLAGDELAKCAQEQVDALKAEGCDYIVCLGHLGIDDESVGNRSVDLLAKVTGIDVFIDGHSHSTLEDVWAVTETNGFVGDTLLTSTGTKLENVGMITIDPVEKKIGAETIPSDTITLSDEIVAARAAEIQAQVDAEYGAVFAKTEVLLNGERDPGNRTEETNLGNLITDALVWGAGQQGETVDAAVTNGGGIRASIAAGDITKKDVNTVLPFGNTLSIVKVTGNELLEALEASTYCTPTAIGGFPQVSGIVFTVDAGVAYAQGEQYPASTYFAPASIGRVTIESVGGKDFDPAATYTIATNDFMASGGDTYYAFKAATVNYDLGVPMDEVLMDYITEALGGAVTTAQYGAAEGRITVVNAPTAETPEEPAAPADWADVDQSAWYAAAVNYVIENGVMGSTDAGVKVFTPNGTVTRATVYQTLYNMAGKPAVAEAASFSDVAGKWYADSAAWAEDVGLTTGDGTGAYAGDRNVTRAEIATIFARYAALNNMVTAAGDLSTYADVADVAEWAKDGMCVAVGSGIIGGKPGNLLDPNGTAVRTELATILMNYSKLSPGYTVETVAIEVPETDGVPAHTIPAIVTLPEGEGKYPAVVMLHGTGSDKHEAGGGYDLAAPAMALSGIATIRFDFMGNGESTASYADYSYTSANLDAKAAADYMAGLESIDGGKLAVMGWSQGGTNALLAAAEYPETFQAVITWSGALELGILFSDFDAAYATAKKDGSYTLTFDWREPLPVGVRWFEDVKNTDVRKEIAKIQAPVLAINGDQDTTVTPDNAVAIAQAAQNGRSWLIKGADHTYNIFTGDFTAITQTINVGIGFLEETFNGALEPAYAASVSKYGNVTTTLPVDLFDGAGYAVGDILKITVGDQTIEAPYGTAYANVDNGSVIVLPDASTGTVAIAINMGNFASTYNVTADTPIVFAMGEKEGYLEEYEIRNIDSLRTNDRADYASDEVFANFRPVVMGDIAEGVLFRSSSPVNPELGRNTYADALVEKAGVKTAINLADSQEELAAYEGYADSYYATLNVVALDMGVDFAAEDFNAKLKTGLEFLIANEGPYVIHCNEGKDRAGFTAALLEAVCGASVGEIVEDYMRSYENYYHVEYHSDRWFSIANSNIIKTLCTITGTETQADLEKADLKAAAEAYLIGTVGLTAEQVAALQSALTTPVTAEKAA